MLQRAYYLIAISRPFSPPVNRAIQRRGAGQHKQVLTSRRGLGFIGARAGANVDARIFGHGARFKHGPQITSIIARHEFIVMGELRVGSLDTEQQHHSAATRFEFIEGSVVVALPMFRIDQLAIGVDDIAVGHHGVGMNGGPVFEHDAGGMGVPPVLLFRRRHGRDAHATCFN